ncbi:transcriptional repressor [Acinetobacter sp. S40]|uniref:Fur family transcriptional regulator n=1 Tax=Acinetobacter sp. S40 TaxID=2767434 RepID=UPI00190B9747|nr:transcriptional repressor [Acinetobacter sp. S40]MBJ9985725.1 transcriptional repressor [Acinetobacter sp. S40]
MESHHLEEVVLNILKKAKLRATLPRIHVVKTLIEANKEITAYEIERKVAQKNRKNVYISTIYSSLRALEMAGVIQRFKIGDQQAYYSIKKQNGSIRLYCEECEKTYLLDNSDIEKNILNLSENRNISIKSFSLFIQIKCEECMKKK